MPPRVHQSAQLFHSIKERGYFCFDCYPVVGKLLFDKKLQDPANTPFCLVKNRKPMRLMLNQAVYMASKSKGQRGRGR